MKTDRQGLGGCFFALEAVRKNICFFTHFSLDISPLDLKFLSQKYHNIFRLSTIYKVVVMLYRGFNNKIKEFLKLERIKTLKQIYKQLLRLIITDEPMIKTTTGKVKRFEEVKKM